jgi:hypothetical protein
LWNASKIFRISPVQSRKRSAQAIACGHQHQMRLSGKERSPPIALSSATACSDASGLKRQDNDLIVIESGKAAVEFKHAFDARFAGGEPLPRSIGR